MESEITKTKRYAYSYNQYEDEGKNASSLIEDMLSDPDFGGLNGIVIGSWGGPWEESCQPLIDGIAANTDRFSHIQSLFIGDMDYEDCEVSWIMQGNYEKLWDAMPQLKELTIKGSTDLSLGRISHEHLESLTIICGGLPPAVIRQIQEARLPNLKKLLLYVGVDYYGFDGDADTVREFLEASDFPRLSYLGIADSELQDEMAEVVLNCKYIRQIHTLDLSCGTLTDKGGALLLETLPALPNIKKLDIHYHYLTDGMMQNIAQLPIETDTSEQCEAEEDDGDIFRIAMLTE